MSRHRRQLNKYQKAAFRPGEHRVRQDEIAYYLSLAYSEEPLERLEAAQNLCPCHVRTSHEDVQQAIYTLMEDADVRVRRAAWHTLEDGGCPVDPQLDIIFEKAVRHEKDKQVRRFVEMFALPRVQEKEQKARLIEERSPFATRGKCDSCGEANQRVKPEYATEINVGRSSQRFARICENCASAAG